MIATNFHSTKKVSHLGEQVLTHRHRSGAVVLEFGFISVVLVFIVLGMIETSRGVMVKETMNNAARSVCRLAVLGKGSNATIEEEVKKILKEHNLPEPQ